MIGWWCTHYTVGAAVALPFAGWMMDYFGHSASPGQSDAVDRAILAGRILGAGGRTGVVLCAHLAVPPKPPEDVGLPPIEEYHGEPAIAAHAEESSRSNPAEDSWTVIGEVLADAQHLAARDLLFLDQVDALLLLFLGTKVRQRKSRERRLFASAMTAAAMPIGGFVGVIVIGYISDKCVSGPPAPVDNPVALGDGRHHVRRLHPHRQHLAHGRVLFLGRSVLVWPDSMISATAAMDFGTKRGAGTATGFVNGIGSIGGILGGYLPGVITGEEQLDADCST